MIKKINCGLSGRLTSRREGEAVRKALVNDTNLCSCDGAIAELFPESLQSGETESPSPSAEGEQPPRRFLF